MKRNPSNSKYEEKNKNKNKKELTRLDGIFAVVVD